MASPDKQIALSWQSQVDSLESSALTRDYLLYVGVEGEGWQTPIKVSGDNYLYELPKYGKRYRFRVTACNEGGESFPSETLSACLFRNDRKTALLVNGFDRIGAPAFFDEGDKAGIAWWRDEGVPFHTEFAFVGYQYDFNRNSKWQSDDAPGWGASGVEGWSQQIAGNTFDFPHRHGEVFQRNKVSYISCSRKAFENGQYVDQDISLLNIIFGEQRGTRNFANENTPVFEIYTPEMRRNIAVFARSETPMLLSGAYLASDLMDASRKDELAFARDTLFYKPASDKACNTGEFIPVLQGYKLDAGSFNTTFSPVIYRVESPDALEPVDQRSSRLYRYKENGLSAGVFTNVNGLKIILGFPFETIQNAEVQDQIVRLLLQGSNNTDK